MQRGRGLATRRLAAAAVISALGVVLLWVGSILQVLDLAMAAIVSLLVVFAVIEIRGPYPFLIYAVTSVLSLLLLPVKTPALAYAAFAGYYPMVKAVLERRLARPLSWVVKTVIFVVGVALALLVAVKVLLQDPSVLLAERWVLLLAIPVFVLYDIGLTRMITAYLRRWQGRFRFLNLH